jgi:uncharacterized protein YggU (UPF0235/DUF167 family)
MGVRAVPATARTAFRGLYAGKLKISLTAPPEDGRANRQLEEALAGWLGLQRSQVRVHSGYGSRDKVVAFTGIDEAQLRERVAGLVSAARREH